MVVRPAHSAPPASFQMIVVEPSSVTLSVLAAVEPSAPRAMSLTEFAPVEIHIPGREASSPARSSINEQGSRLARDCAAQGIGNRIRVHIDAGHRR